MNGIVTLNELLNINDAIEKMAEKNIESNELLTERICEQYDIVDIKKKLTNLFIDFRSARYLYNFPVSDSIRTTPVYQKDESFHQRSNVSQVENAVARYVDKQILTTNIYHSILSVSSKFIDEEVIYMINAFLVRKSEEDIAEILGISKTYLQRYKKSCLVKMWTELRQYCEDD